MTELSACPTSIVGLHPLRTDRGSRNVQFAGNAQLPGLNLGPFAKHRSRHAGRERFSEIRVSGGSSRGVRCSIGDAPRNGQLPGLNLGHFAKSRVFSEIRVSGESSRGVRGSIGDAPRNGQLPGLNLGRLGKSRVFSEIRVSGGRSRSWRARGVRALGFDGNGCRRVQFAGTGQFGKNRGDRERFLDIRVRASDADPEPEPDSDAPRSWFRRFLFESIEMPDSDMESDEAEDPDADEGELVDFEPRADGETPESKDAVDAMLEDDARFFRWKMKNEVRNEVREFEASGRDPDGKEWEDWLDDSWNQYEDNLEGGEDGWYEASPNWDKDGVPREPPTKPERGMKRTIKELLFRILEPEDEVEEDLQFEERVFRFTSRTTAKFVGVLIIVPWITDFIIHDFMLVPFLETYVEKVPLASEVLDIRESQKLKIIESLKLERQRLRFEAEIGKTPPLSDDELSEHIREDALELREEYRLENRQSFASIWSDFAAGLTILLLLILNPKQVAIMKLTGERLFTNISDTGKAFIIILLTDIFLGYHSESGWETVSEMVLEHYGIEVSQAAIYIFVAIVPVTIDACFKLWVFRFFRTLSPSASATFREMQRH